MKHQRGEMPNNHDQQKINVKIRMEIEDYEKHDCMCDPKHIRLSSRDLVLSMSCD